MVGGSCLCGAVAFEIDPAGVALTVGCRCANCRKVSGGDHGVYLQVKHGAFRWVAGEDLVQRYESSPGNNRGFCAICGCVAPVATPYGAMRAPAGALDGDPGVTPDVMLYAPRRVAWCDAEHATEQFDESGTPDFWRRMIVKLAT